MHTKKEAKGRMEEAFYIFTSCDMEQAVSIESLSRGLDVPEEKVRMMIATLFKDGYVTAMIRKGHPTRYFYHYSQDDVWTADDVSVLEVELKIINALMKNGNKHKLNNLAPYRCLERIRKRILRLDSSNTVRFYGLLFDARKAGIATEEILELFLKARPDTLKLCRKFVRDVKVQQERMKK